MGLCVWEWVWVCVCGAAHLLPDEPLDVLDGIGRVYVRHARQSRAAAVPTCRVCKKTVAVFLRL